MANHYSGKRAAGRKPVGKRALSLLMALVMSLSLVQITAFAENDTAADKTQVVEAGGIAYYDKDGTPLVATDNGEPENWVVKVERTLKETGTENLLDVDLKVTTKDNTVSTDAEAATVLVIDTSGSMGYCAVCGQENGHDHGKTGYKWVYECKSKQGSEWADENGDGVCDNCGKEWTEGDWFWWDYTHTSKRVAITSHTFESRLTAAKKAAKDFLDNYILNGSGNISTKPRYVAVVEFAKDAYTRQAIVDVTKEENRNAAKRVIDNLGADGGTNTEAGLQLASNLLAGMTTENQFVVLLTDGQPTYAIGTKGDRSGTTGPIPGAGRNHYINDGTDTPKEVTGPVENISSALKTNGVHVYGVVYGLTKQDGTMETVPNGSGKDTPIDTWMKDDCKMDGAFSADSTDALNAAFKTIINTIQHETVGTTVVTAVNNEVGEGALTDLYSFVKFNGDSTGAAVNNHQVTWDLSKATPGAGTADNEKTYHLSYQVWMHTEDAGFQAGKAYSLGEATLSYKMTGDETAKTAEFPEISAKGYLGELNFTKVEPVGNEFAPLSGADFKLTVVSNPGHTRPLKGTSDNGAVAISDIPSGYTYTLSETKAPEGYVKTDKTWTVTVSYGEVTVDGESPDGFQVVNTPEQPEPPTETEFTAAVKYYYSDNGIDGTYTYDAAKDATITVKAAALPVTVAIEDKADGYTFNGNYTTDDKAVSSLTAQLTEDGQEFHVYYYKDAAPTETEFTATVKYYYSDNGIDGTYTYNAAKDATITVKAAALPVTVTIEDKADGYTFNGNYTTDDKAVSSLTAQLTEDGQEFHVYYYKDAAPTPATYTVTVKYISNDIPALTLKEDAVIPGYAGDAHYTVAEGTDYYFEELTYDGTVYTLLGVSGDPSNGFIDNQNRTVVYIYGAEEVPPYDAIALRKHATNLDGNFITNIALSIRPEELREATALALTAEDDYNHYYPYTYVAAGSYVEDYMGYVADDYNFDFVNEAATISLQYGEAKLSAVKLDVDSAEYTYYAFGDKFEEPSVQEAGDDNVTTAYPFVLRYFAANDGTEMFTLFINVDVLEELTLNYSEKLINPVTTNDTYEDITYGAYYGQGVPGIYSIREGVDGNYGLFTNSEAMLRVYKEDWVDDDGNADPRWISYPFPMPTVSYTVSGQDRPTPPPVGPSYDYYTVTVNYYDKDSGEVIHTAYTTTQREYTAYDVTAQDKIAITGYTYVETTGDALTGTLNGNKVINVYYTKDSDIDDGNTPTDPGTDIGDDDVPVTPAQPPKTGDSMGLWIAAAMVSGMGLIWLSLSGKKRKEEI